MSKSYHIQWVEADPDHLAEEHYAHLFMLVRKDRIVYIENSFHRSIQELIPATISAANLNGDSTQIFLGRIVEFSGLQTSEVNDVLQLLVYASKPALNLSGKRNYEADGNICLHNTGMAQLPQTVKANNYGVFLSKRLAASVYAVA